MGVAEAETLIAVDISNNNISSVLSTIPRIPTAITNPTKKTLVVARVFRAVGISVEINHMINAMIRKDIVDAAGVDTTTAIAVKFKSSAFY